MTVSNNRKGSLLSSLQVSLQAAQQLLAESHHAVALTGAGISTPSGIPDFRSDNGIWSRFDPSIATLSSFRRRPEEFYEWLHPLTQKMLAAHPNPAHHALAAMERQGTLKGVITQNIDGLHHAAGSQEVYEIHGHSREASCLRCHSTFPATNLMQQFANDIEQLPRCPHCASILKPNVVLFGEMLPSKIFRAAEEAVQAADLMIVAGSSLEVGPVNDFPQIVKRNGARLLIINLTPTYADRFADLVIHEPVETMLPVLAQSLSIA